MASAPTKHPWARPIPNALSVLRIGAAGLLPFSPVSWWLWLIVFAGVSDWLDGYIARRFDAMSRSGALLDGIADKLFVLAAVVTLVRASQISLWQGALIMARDISVGLIATACVLRGAWHAFGQMEARMAGKLTTAFAIPWFATQLAPGAEAFRMPLFVLAAAASVWAAIDYLNQLRVKVGALDSDTPA